MALSENQSAEAPYLAKNCRSPYSRTEIFRQRLWSFTQAVLFRPTPEKFHLWRVFLLRCFGADIPDLRKVVIFPTARVYFPWKLRLEPRSMIGRCVDVYNLAPVTLHRGANISQNVHLCAGSHDFLKWEMPLVAKPIIIGENAWIGADVFIGPGVTIGELCVVGARSVVVRDLPARKICVGHPCLPIKDRPAPE